MITLTREEAEQVLDVMEGSIDAQEWEINDHITKYGEWFRPQRVEYMKQQLANIHSTIEALRARLAQHEPVKVSPHEFVEVVTGKENLVGITVMWAEWPTKEATGEQQ